MNDKQFIKDAIRTESPNFFQPNTRILHAAIGCVTESGELLDALKKQMYYGRELDLTNVKEEAGDLLYYLAILFDELGTDFQIEADRVINKLRVRFPNKFEESRAYDRDLKSERVVLDE
jgi:NTP pyrophosphatase (non-canonical NTP hydrolase)